MQVTVTIRGRQYTVRGEESVEDVEAVARDLDKRLEDVAGRTRTFDEYTVALLTALNLASELRRLRKQVMSQLDDLDRDAASLSALLEAALPSDLEPPGSSDA
jgi:cell division protein ZapA (FtsZ GTPase activity inhibitor)